MSRWTQARGAANEMDEYAWRRLLERHRSRVQGLCFRILGQAEDAEDACGEAFLRVQKSRDHYDSSRPFAQWILSIASRVAIDRLRRRGLESRLFEPLDPGAGAWEPADVSVSPLEATLAKERRRSLRSAIADLEPRDRAVLTMKYFGYLSYDEIGDALELTRAHVGTLIFRAKTRLRARLASNAGTSVQSPAGNPIGGAEHEVS